MKTVQYSVVDKVLDVPLQNPDYPEFLMGAYKTNVNSWSAEHAILYTPALDRLGDAPLLRVNSACFTGDIFGDRRCDCTEQLFRAMDLIKMSAGLIIYHFHHEGRGLGLSSKLRTYKRMTAEGISTFKAMTDLTNRPDLRTYGSAVQILKDLEIRRVRLITNNPAKRLVLEENGIEVIETVPVISHRPEIARYLGTKRDEQGHAIEP